MRASTIVALAAIAAAAPSLAAPVASPAAAYSRRATTSSGTAPVATGSDDVSSALSLGTVASIASFAAPVISGLIDHFKNK